jgi:hypothetical protein
MRLATSTLKASQSVALCACLFLSALLARPASADETYSYTGNEFNVFEGTFNCPPECRISGSFTVATPLPPLRSFSELIPGTYTYSFTDGLTTWNPSNSIPFDSVIQVSTDASGNIANWFVMFILKGTVQPLMSTTGGSGGAFDLATSNEPPPNSVGEVENDPGTWKRTAGSVPEPSARLMLAIGLAGLLAGLMVAGWRRGWAAQFKTGA